MTMQLVSYLAPNAFWFYQAVAEYLSRSLGREMQLIQSQFDPLEDPMLLQDRLDLAFVCGLPFSRYCRSNPGQWQAIAAPAMQAERYSDRPVYFADIIVNSHTNLKKLSDLAGKTFCYNDLGSNSGYHLFRYHLFKAGYANHFFGNLIASGLHQRSIKFVVEGIADCAAIDSTVLEQELRDFPELSSQLRAIATIGPCPMPPIAASKRLDSTLIEQIQSALVRPDAEFKLAMEKAQIRRYASVTSADYDELGLMFAELAAADYQL